MSSLSPGAPRRLRADWDERIPESEWSAYRPVLEAAQAREIPFAVGGGLAYSAYARRWRDTKDLDLYILESDRENFVGILGELGFHDYHDEAPYDREWIYRGQANGRIVDLIWQMANYRTAVDAGWLTRGPLVRIHGLQLRLLPLEELIWSKLYVLQRERCDWPDLLNILSERAPELDWEHMLDQVAEDAPVLGGLLSIFGWLRPARTRGIPAWVWERVGLNRPPAGRKPVERRRAALLDRRDWFGPTPGRQEGAVDE